MEQFVASEAKNRAVELLEGVLRYVETPYERKVSENPVIWRRGNARLIDYGQGACEDATQLVLFVPSLINRYYILDLEEERSMLRYVSEQGLYPLVLDWDEPGAFEKDFDCNDYITKILLPAIDYLVKISGQSISLAGYCMGGVLALAAAALKPKQVSSLTLLATPWDFHCKAFKPFVVEKAWQPMLKNLIESQATLPADVIQSLFYITDPFVFEQKFRRFSSLGGESRAAKDFVALERWVNDGIPMTAPLARDCLIEWAQKNILAKGEWNIDGKKIDPKKITMPVLIAMPQSDHVVPIDCASPLAKAMPHAKILRPSAGHVGMIVGHHAKKELWQHFVRWVKNH